MKILIAEDDRISRMRLKGIVEKWGYEADLCETGIDALEKIQTENSPSLVILDWMMPGLNGVDLCRKIRELNIEPYKYIILLTSRTEKEDLIIGMEAGADDYVAKPFNPDELKMRLRAGRRILELHEQLLGARNILKIQAMHDPLTAAMNRGGITDALTQELDRSQREKSEFSVVMLDLDYFKRVNDTYGHIAGDKVLNETVKRLRANIRIYDSLGRYGGEEFLIIMPNTDRSNAMKQAERVRRAISDEPMDTSEGIFNVTISIGVHVFNPQNGDDAESAIKSADQALYEAKNAGRNCVMMADSNRL
ncbi:diguanylate cyclase [Pseudomonadota bacterium]